MHFFIQNIIQIDAEFFLNLIYFKTNENGHQLHLIVVFSGVKFHISTGTAGDF